ncbi:hypothetical protein CAZ16_00035 [Pseudomonas aeruginosa]|nr:hypothetical protein BH602_14520 [Pseudomonas aeruginosa]OTI91017.1 hypothetical protein CAZ16_00035 [Pseudomonas aeruginosa]OTI96042.1 hypothetical protein CAZ32_03880 [Pseudomonas aeruginosa]OTJ03024.1 hypothetical protein CAZ21_00035 [Pseudomonas aeruginosa]OTJ05741.1 hypothetical protein CAZ12_31465 [Pseudomonas aeruginosa]
MLRHVFSISGLGRDTLQFEQFCVGLFHIILKVPTNELGLTESYRADILEVTAALLISTDQCKDGAQPLDGLNSGFEAIQQV